MAVRCSTLAAMVLIGAGLSGGQALALNFGSVTLKPGEVRTIDFTTSTLTMRVCNDFFSAGAVVTTIGDSPPHDLSPGLCAEEIGYRMTIQSHASGPATVEFRSLSDVPGSRQLE